MNGDEYVEYGFENESEFEKSVIENCKFLFGPNSIYIDIKRRIGNSKSYNKGIPDGYVIDFSNNSSPQLYFVENELSSHDIYSHISEQIARFNTMIVTSKRDIRDILLHEVKRDSSLNQALLEKIRGSRFENLDQLMIELTERTNIKILVVIDEIEDDLRQTLSSFKNQPDVILLQRFIKNGKIAYCFEPLTQVIPQQILLKNSVKSEKPLGEDFDTIVCPAYEEGFQRAYIGQSAWWAVRISAVAREKLKYLAIYQKAPISAVQNVAEIVRIEPFEDSGKYKVYLKNKKTIQPIKMDKPGAAPQGPRFTTFQRLLTSKKLSDLWEYWV